MSDEAQRPLIDVAKSFGKSFNFKKSSIESERHVTRQNLVINENQPTTPRPPRMLTPSLHTPTRNNPYAWKANLDAVPCRPSFVENGSRPYNPYSWKAPSKSPTPAATCNTDSRSPWTAPRPSSNYLPKYPLGVEPLTITIPNDSQEYMQGQQVPLQPFSPTGNSRECTCHRNPKIILCQSCGEIRRGRLSMACVIHPRKVFLMDLKCCPSCKSVNLKEVFDA